MKNLVALGISHRTAPVAVRERFAFGVDEADGVISRLRGSGLAAEGVLVSTCNRTELFAVTVLPPGAAQPDLLSFIESEKGVDRTLCRHWSFRANKAAVEQLFRVAAGLDSQVLGETEILGQLKQAYARALAAGHTGKMLNQTFQSAFNFAKHVRTETGIQRGHTSVASVAVELAESILGGLAHRDVMVVGAGDTGEKTARALLGRGARSVIVSNRSFERAGELARELGGRAVRFDAWESEFDRMDVIISSTRAPHFILDRTRLARLLAARRARPLLLIDLAVPRDIDPAVRELPEVFLADLDDLESTAERHRQSRRAELDRCETLIRERAVACLARIMGTPAVPAAALGSSN
jgi:glutamyl-tRNA reductase